MRYLTIKRTKSIVGCLSTMKVYVEDHFHGEITINNIPCRKLGELKNGEINSFEIEERALKVFVIADRISKSYCNEYYQLSEGQKDVFLSGQNRFNIASGNAFRFDNNNNSEIASNRKKGTLKGAFIWITVVVLSSFIGSSIGSCMISNMTSKSKTFSYNGMKITLTESFAEAKSDSTGVVYTSNGAIVIAVCTPFSSVKGAESCTLEQYTDMTIDSLGVSGIISPIYDDLAHFEYFSFDPDTKEEHARFYYTYKSDDAFWIFQFVTSEKNADKYREKITKWAKSVSFS